jgi:hypothetical protein
MDYVTLCSEWTRLPACLAVLSASRVLPRCSLSFLTINLIVIITSVAAVVVSSSNPSRLDINLSPPLSLPQKQQIHSSHSLAFIILLVFQTTNTLSTSASSSNARAHHSVTTTTQ